MTTNGATVNVSYTYRNGPGWKSGVRAVRATDVLAAAAKIVAAHPKAILVVSGEPWFMSLPEGVKAGCWTYDFERNPAI